MRLLSAALALAWLSGSWALYEDQAGQVEWLSQHVGSVAKAVLHRSKPRLFVSTEKDAVASLSLRDGSIAWRKVLAEGDTVNHLAVLDKPSVVLSASGQCRYVRAWDQIDGSLKWEALEAGASASAPCALVALESAGLVISLAAGRLRGLSASDGRVKWSAAIDVGDADVAHLVATDSSALLFAYRAGSSTIFTAEVDAADGSVTKKATLTASLPLSASSVTTTSLLAAQSADQSSLCFASTSEASCQALQTLAPKLASGASLLHMSPTPSGLAVASPTGAAIISLQDARGAKLTTFVEGASMMVTDAVPLDADSAVGLTSIDAASGDLTLRVVSTSSGSVLLEETVPALAAQRALIGGAAGGAKALPRVAVAALGAYKRSKDNAQGFRVLLAFSDGWLALAQQSALVWSREEALGSVTASLFVDLPAPGEAQGAAKHSLGERVRLQVLTLKVQLKLAVAEEREEYERLRLRFKVSTLPFRDLDGLRKQVVVLTAAGRLAALHNGDGRLLWAVTYPEGAVPQHMFLWRTFHDKTTAPQLLLIHSALQGKGSYASIIDVHSGRELQRLELPYAVDKVLPTGLHLHDGTAEQRTLLLLSSQQTGAGGGGSEALPAVHLLPDTEQARTLFAAKHRSLFFWLRDASGSAISGYGFADGSTLQPLQLWRLEFPDPVLTIASRDSTEEVHSASKVLGDRSLMHKYLNPNTLLVATGLQPGLQPEGAGDLPALTVSIVDSVTGRILHRQVHAGGRGPVHAVVSENWAAYQFWGSASGRYEAAVIEMFDASPHELSIADYIMQGQQQPVASSFNDTPLSILSQSYYSPMPLRGLAVTRTARGITTKQLLMGTANGQVYLMDRRFVDPRRPHLSASKKLTAAQQEEGLLPYSDTLPIMPTQFVTLDKAVAGLHSASLLVAPTNLESTCLLFVHGLDLFATRLTPARQAFDSLTDDFNYALLVLAISGLLLATVIVHHITKAAALKAKWQ